MTTCNAKLKQNLAELAEEMLVTLDLEVNEDNLKKMMSKLMNRQVPSIWLDLEEFL